MSTNNFTEESYENTLIQLFQDLGYQYECGYNVEREYRNPYYEADLQDALRRQNPMLSDEVLQEAFRLVTHVNEGILEQRNETLMDYVQNGVEVKYSEDGRAKTALVRLVNFESPLQNQFKVVNQWTVVAVFIDACPVEIIHQIVWQKLLLTPCCVLVCLDAKKYVVAESRPRIVASHLVNHVSV